MQIGFVGLGHMGLPMTKNLLAKQWIVRAFDTSAAALQDARDLGAVVTRSLAELAGESDVIVTMLPTPPVVRHVVAGPNGILASARRGTLIIDCSTGDPQTAKEISSAASAAGMLMIDAPVSGGVPGARAATLTFMVGGSAAGFQAAQPVLSAMGKNLVHCGPEGSGQIAKLCNNLLLGVSTVAVSESMCLGVRLGLAPEVLAGIINSSSGHCWVSEVYNPYPGIVSTSPASNHFKGGFACDLMIKDLSLALDAAQVAQQALPMAAVAKQLFQLLSHQGAGEQDITAMVTMFKQPLEQRRAHSPESPQGRAP